MLKALYDYALQHQLTLPPGYGNKTIKAWIWLKSDDPDFAEVLPGDETPIPCPDVGSAKQGDKCNLFAEKRYLVMAEENPQAKNEKQRSISKRRSEFFLRGMKDCAADIPVAGVCVRALETPETKARIQAELDRHKVKVGDTISFKVDAQSIPSMRELIPWWAQYLRTIKPADKAQRLVPCLITGELTTPAPPLPETKGIPADPGAKSQKPKKLICFNKEAAAFNSYNFTQTENAPVSEEAYMMVNAALEHLLKDAPTLADMKFVHWYDADLPPEDDPIPSTFGIPMEENDAEEERHDTPMELQQKERDAVQKADRLVRATKTGEQAHHLDCSYHILLLSGVGGRVMVRRYEQGSYEELVQRLREWETDLALTHPFYEGDLRPCRLTTRLLRLIQYSKADERMDFESRKKRVAQTQKELSGLTPAVITAILTGAPLPDAVAFRALSYIRSKMLAPADANETQNTSALPDARACQWLKAWLMRKKTETRQWLMSTFNEDARSDAYFCGAIVAVYAALQQDAMEDINASLTQRYYGAAVQTPAYAITRLSSMSVHYLEKMNKDNLKKWRTPIYENYLQELNSRIRGSYPTTLMPAEQSEFVLGYYQMGARIQQERNARITGRK